MTDVASDKTDLFDDDWDRPVDHRDEFRVVKTVEVRNQHFLILNDLHADLTPELPTLAVLL